MNRVSDFALQVLLWVLGHGVCLGSRFMPSLRTQINRTLTFEIRAGGRVARHWRFYGHLHRADTYSGSAERPDHAVIFTSSWQALRAFTSPRAVDRIVTDLHAGTIKLIGSAFVLLWFYGLTRRIFPIGRGDGIRKPIPDAYLAHDSRSCGDETIIVLPAVSELDPQWKNAWNARAKLWMVRVATGEPMPDP